MEAPEEIRNGEREPQETAEPREREMLETRAKYEYHESREDREPREPREYHEPRDSREYSHREPRGVRDYHEPREYREPREYGSMPRGDHHSRRSRSRSPHRGYNHDRHRRHHRSRSRSEDRGYLRSRRERPQRDFYARENPPPSDVLGVFGLSTSTRERDLDLLFSKYGKVEQSGTSRGFGFINFASVEEASAAKAKLDGMFVHERCIRVDFSITHRAHSPTPGEYMGEPKRASHHAYRYPRRPRSRSRSPEYERRRSYYRTPPRA